MPAQREAMMLGAKLQRRPRFFPWEHHRLRGPAESSHWTRWTLGPGAAGKRAQFHEGGIVLAGVAAWDELCGDGPKPLASGARVDRRLQVEDAGEDAGDVRFDDRDRLVEGEGGDGVRGVTANPRKLPD